MIHLIGRNNEARSCLLYFMTPGRVKVNEIDIISGNGLLPFLPFFLIPFRLKFLVQKNVIAFHSHCRKLLFPAFPGGMQRSYNKLVVMDLKFNFILQLALLQYGLWNPDASGVTYLDYRLSFIITL